MENFSIAVIPGDGIGPEVMAEGIKVLKAIESVHEGLRYKSHEHLDFIVVRENTEGEYSNMGGRMHEGTPYELAVQNSVFTRYGIERVVRYAYSLVTTKH